MRLRNYTEALAALDRAIALKPDYQNAFLNRAVLKRQMGDREGAAQDLGAGRGTRQEAALGVAVPGSAGGAIGGPTTGRCFAILVA